ncbi:MAG: hypothetical protein HeimC2_16540 [Candidatus Heimdallarchaeota archaeon LC_2]|nr:MAG: hypothetical protein HeimC2_16540 [Candidatus Heimdallarchaeota archaeon LC_2]
MNIPQRILLLTSLGQIHQLRLWLPNLEFPVPPDLGIKVLNKEDGDLLIMSNLDMDLYRRLSQFVDFLKFTNIFDKSMYMFEADFDSNIIFPDRSIIFSVMLSSSHRSIDQSQLILTYHSDGDLKELDELLQKEWKKRISIFDDM